MSLKSENHIFSDTAIQLDVLHNNPHNGYNFPVFAKRIQHDGFESLTPSNIDTFQVNIGKMCNQTCSHCHVDAGPDRKEIMTRETMEQCIKLIRDHKFSIVDITGGAPEMNPNFRWFVEQISALNVHIIVRCNLTIIVSNKAYHDLPEFYKKHHIEVVASLPHFSERRTDAQRGDGVFERSIRALKMLNTVGYGLEDSELQLNLVYNPSGAFLPGSQESLEMEFKRRLKNSHDIRFSKLFAITNLPISRFLDYLVASGNYEDYMQKLIDAYNPTAVEGVMCRNTLSVGWEGSIYDCDFNQMLELKVNSPSQHINDFDLTALKKRRIVTDQHCYGCTAGAGSSCGGQTA
jgi:radical SAM/Cys-rich protein